MDNFKCGYNKAISDVSKIFYSDKSLSSIFYDIDKFIIKNTTQEESQLDKMTNQQKIDSKLFMEMYSLFESMSIRGKETAIETLILCLSLKEE